MKHAKNVDRKSPAISSLFRRAISRAELSCSNCRHTRDVNHQQKPFCCYCLVRTKGRKHKRRTDMAASQRAQSINGELICTCPAGRLQPASRPLPPRAERLRESAPCNAMQAHRSLHFYIQLIAPPHAIDTYGRPPAALHSTRAINGPLELAGSPIRRYLAPIQDEDKGALPCSIRAG